MSIRIKTKDFHTTFHVRVRAYYRDKFDKYPLNPSKISTSSICLVDNSMITQKMLVSLIKSWSITRPSNQHLFNYHIYSDGPLGT